MSLSRVRNLPRNSSVFPSQTAHNKQSGCVCIAPDGGLSPVATALSGSLSSIGIEELVGSMVPERKIYESVREKRCSCYTYRRIAQRAVARNRVTGPDLARAAHDMQFKMPTQQARTVDEFLMLKVTLIAIPKQHSNPAFFPEKIVVMR